MAKRIATILVAAPFLLGICAAWNAVGGIQSPSRDLASLSSGSPSVVVKKEAPQKAVRKPTFAKFKEIISRFRPVSRSQSVDYFEAERVLESQRTVNDLFDKDMANRMRDKYQELVAGNEKVVNDPYRRARTWEVERYDNSRSDLARWTAKEVLNQELKEFLKGADQSSSAMQMISAVREVTGGGEEKAEKALTPEEKIARAHRLDLAHVKSEEPSIPTRLRTKLNLLKGHGQFTLQNPIVTTSVAVNAGSGENVNVEMNREFSKLDLSSKMKYSVDESLLHFNVNKRITKEVSLDLDSQRYTRGKSSSSGERRRDTAKVVYSLSF